MSTSKEEEASLNCPVKKVKEDSDVLFPDEPSKGRVRRTKKPEIQLYQPRALREKLRSQSNDPVKSPHESSPPKGQGDGRAVREKLQNQLNDPVVSPHGVSSLKSQEEAAPKTKEGNSTKTNVSKDTKKAEVKEYVKSNTLATPSQEEKAINTDDVKDKGHGGTYSARKPGRKKKDMSFSSGDFSSNDFLANDVPNSSGVKGKKNVGVENKDQDPNATHESMQAGLQQKGRKMAEKKLVVDRDSKVVNIAPESKGNSTDMPGRQIPPKEEKGFTDSKASEKKNSMARDRHFEKLPKRERYISDHDPESPPTSISESVEIKSAEFYPSPKSRKEIDHPHISTVKIRNDGNGSKPGKKTGPWMPEYSEKKQYRSQNDRGNKRFDESVHEEHAEKTFKGQAQHQKGRKAHFSRDYNPWQDFDTTTYQRENKQKDLDVAELAAKVDQISFEKSQGSKNKWKDGDTYEHPKENLNTQRGRKKGDFKDDWGTNKDSRSLEVTPLGAGLPTLGEKCSKAKSYSGLRENRKNKNVKKSFGIDKPNIEVTVGRDGQGRTTQVKNDNRALRQNSEDTKHRVKHRKEFEEKDLDDEYSSPDKVLPLSGYKMKRQMKSTGILELPDKGNRPTYGKDTFDDKDCVEPMNFIEIPDCNWGEEVDRDVPWDDVRESNVRSRAPTWEDEKPPWRHERDKRRPEKQDAYSKRAESPGHRGGLIQLPSTFSTPENVSKGQTFSEHAEPTPVLQKHLYNPNNPSKPVPVVPSARDLPLSRDTHRESSKGLEEGVGSLSLQSHHAGGNVPENPNPKVDPTILYNIQKGELDISYYVNSNQLPMEFRRIMDIRHHLQSCYKQLLMCDIRMCQENNIEGALWKTLYYTIIEKLREYISREPGLKDRSLATLRMLVDEGQQYLQGLLEALQKEYNFTLEDHLEEEGILSSGMIRTRSIRMPLMSAQKLLLSLGDLARYKEHYNSTPNYTLARKWYHMALQIYPRNGRPFNQLAIVAANQKRPLDVVYYYVRSLTASNPFVSARDSLVSMFDDIRKKYKSDQGGEQNAEGIFPHEGRGSSSEGLRQEIWIRPDSGATHRRTLSQSTDEEEKDVLDDLKKLPLDQLMKRFLTSYLHCHGMLFSRVGLDEFPKCCQSMLREFTVLLHSNPPRLSTNHLIQILAINMYAVKNTEAKETRVGSGYRAAAQELSLVLAHEMFGRLVQLVVELLPHNLQYQQQQLNNAHHSQGHQQQPPNAADPHRLFTPTLAHFMPPLKAWCDWLLYQFSVWNPPPDAHEYSNRECDTSGSTWSSVAELATIMRGFGPPDVELFSVGDNGTAGSGSSGRSPPPNTVLVRLTEDAFLRGYEPLLQAHKNLVYVASGEHMGRACDWARVSQLQKCLCQLLCGVDPPVLRLQKTDQGDVLVSVVDTSPPDTPTQRLSESSLELDLDDSLSESETSDLEEEMEEEVGEGDEDTPLASTVRLLTRRKKLLEKRQRQQRKLHSKLEGSVTLEMEVRPRYLVPDTNCFIEHLEVVQALAKSTPYTLMVPLVVLNELDGLSRDAAVAKYGSVGHAVRVREGASSALHYLREEKPHSVKTVTSQGSVLSSTSFTAEIDMPDATNDDKILSCCVHFCSDSTQRRPIRAGVRRLYREVVLLTEDRNLRVKAHARDVPVRNLLDFARWAGVR